MIADDGIQYNHPDLKQNYDPLASKDINDGDDDPMPQVDQDNIDEDGWLDMLVIRRLNLKRIEQCQKICRTTGTTSTGPDVLARSNIHTRPF